ncbi:MAG: hypothetical protein ACPIOQ_57670, partial [Promethearchaeia archaeon]
HGHAPKRRSASTQAEMSKAGGEWARERRDGRGVRCSCEKRNQPGRRIEHPPQAQENRRVFVARTAFTSLDVKAQVREEEQRTLLPSRS